MGLMVLIALAATTLTAPADSRAPKRDRDGDGLSNRFERKRGLDPRRADSDRDGLRDRFELRGSKTNPRRKDTDADGFSDRRELRAGTNPRRKRSHPRGKRGRSRRQATSFAQPACASGATNTSSAGEVRALLRSGRDACVTGSLGELNLSGIRPGDGASLGTSGAGTLGEVQAFGASNITLRARFESIQIRNSSRLTIDNSVIGGTQGSRVYDQLIFIPEDSDDITIRDSDIGWTDADSSGNTGYGLRVYADSNRLRVERNRFHHLAGDGIQLGMEGADALIDRNEIAYVAPSPDSDEHSDDIQVVEHGPNLRITNNYLHHNGFYYEGGPLTGGSGPYIHAGDDDPMVWENNLVRDEANFMQVGNLGTGGTEKSNLVFRRNTFVNNGTSYGNAPDLMWRLSDGSSNVYERNLVLALFANEFGFSGTTVRDNLSGRHRLDTAGNCVARACNPRGQEPIGFRKPSGVHW